MHVNFVRKLKRKSKFRTIVEFNVKHDEFETFMKDSGGGGELSVPEFMKLEAGKKVWVGHLNGICS